MAKKGKKKAVHHKKRVSGMSSQQSDSLAQAAGAAVGAAAGWYIYTTQKSIQDNLMGLIQAAAGVGLMFFVKAPIAKGIGLGLVASAAIIEGESFGLLSGVTNLPSSSNLKIAGYGDVRQLGAAPGMSFPKPASVGSAAMARKYAGVYK